MAVKNFPNVSPDANPSFTLESNTSSFESSLNKSVQHMELPGARWRGSVAFSNRTRQEANKIKAFMTSLGGQVGRFYLTPFDAYQSGTMSGTGVVDGALASGVSSIPTKGWEADQDTLFEAGDYLEVNGELKMVTEDVAGVDYIEYTGTNLMPSPFDPSGWLGASDPDLSYTSVTETNPSGESFVGEFEYIGPSSAQITVSSYGSVEPVGTDYYFSILAKPEQLSNKLTLFFQYSGGTDEIINIEISTGDYTTTSGGGAVQETRSRPTASGHYLLEVYYKSLTTNGYRVFVYGNFPIGDKIKLQAAYFGKADDYPAQLLATADIPIAPPLRKALAGGESIVTNEPKGKFYLGSNDQSWDINVNGVQSMGFDFIEDVN